MHLFPKRGQVMIIDAVLEDSEICCCMRAAPSSHLAAGLDIKSCNAVLGGDIQMKMMRATCRK